MHAGWCNMTAWPPQDVPLTRTVVTQCITEKLRVPNRVHGWAEQHWPTNVVSQLQLARRLLARSTQTLVRS